MNNEDDNVEDGGIRPRISQTNPTSDIVTFIRVTFENHLPQSLTYTYNSPNLTSQPYAEPGSPISTVYEGQSDDDSHVLPQSSHLVNNSSSHSNERVVIEAVSNADRPDDEASNNFNDRLVSIQYAEPQNLVDNENDVVVIEENSNDISLTNENSGDRSSEENSNLPNINLDGVNKRIDASLEGPPAKVRKIEVDESDGETCPICLESWGNSGDHRLVALKCGHLFGSSCVERWLKALPLKVRSCPTCKTKATMRDLRHIYARKLVAPDTTQITELQQQVVNLQAEKNRVELELEKSKIAHRACLMELDVLRSTLMKNQNTKEPARRQWRFPLEKNLQICREGGCRVLTYNCRTYELYVSQKSVNNLFPGYGIRKVSCIDYKLGQFVHLHPKPIRDITYSQPRDLLLSVGLDSTARIVERGIPSITINTGMPLWSCSWDYLRTNEFYVGGVGGVIHQYDFRNPSTYLQIMRNASDISPVASLCSTEFGLLSCQLNSAWLWVLNARQWEPRAVPVDGSFMSLCYDNMSHRALVCTRPNTSTLEKAKLTLCKLKSGFMSEVTMDIEDTFTGTARSSLMSRATWVKAPGATWVASHSESDSALLLHGVDGAKTMMLHAAEPAIDVCSVQLNGSTLLAALSESRLRIYKAVASS
ncbi:hypothetical protein K1T71_014966 [Dendrolimus kikuchii]|nr:hypothetical protein K1T71_014966 [Dendrolimus kikuchii]